MVSVFDIPDDVWTITCVFLGYQDYITLRQTCTHFNSLMNPHSFRFIGYWRQLCNTIADMNAVANTNDITSIENCSTLQSQDNDDNDIDMKESSQFQIDWYNIFVELLFLKSKGIVIPQKRKKLAEIANINDNIDSETDVEYLHPHELTDLHFQDILPTSDDEEDNWSTFAFVYGDIRNIQRAGNNTDWIRYRQNDSFSPAIVLEHDCVHIYQLYMLSRLTNLSNIKSPFEDGYGKQGSELMSNVFKRELEKACQWESIKCYNFLIEEFIIRANEDYRLMVKKFVGFLYTACYYENFESIRLLFEKAKYYQDWLGIKILKEKYYDHDNDSNKNTGRTSIYLASKRDKPNVLEFLLATVIDLELIDISKGEHSIIAEIRCQGISPLCQAIYHQNNKCVNCLLFKWNVNANQQSPTQVKLTLCDTMFLQYCDCNVFEICNYITEPFNVVYCLRNGKQDDCRIIISRQC